MATAETTAYYTALKEDISSTYDYIFYLFWITWASPTHIGPHISSTDDYIWIANKFIEASFEEKNGSVVERTLIELHENRAV